MLRIIRMKGQTLRVLKLEMGGDIKISIMSAAIIRNASRLASIIIGIICPLIPTYYLLAKSVTG